MGTQNLAALRIGSAVVAGLGRMWPPFARGGRRRRHEELLLELVRQLAGTTAQLAGMTAELHRANLLRHHRLMMDQWDRAIDDPSFAAVLSTLEGISEEKRRQMLFANRAYQTVLLAHRVGIVDQDELLGHLRMLCRGELFQEFWSRTVEHRRSLKSDSLEKRIGEAVDVLLDELADDPEEWWIVGPGPVAPDAPCD
ncbi:DUF6082 family protein [Streptomyces sp. NPDC058676]|uniref:DUF6082 family protein n=1 Tax=unclassified Streptomyces TaxID=2593676 RepID=UPI00364EA5B4